MIRIIDTHNKPKKRLKGVKDVSARDGIIELWENPDTELMIPKRGIPGFDLENVIESMVVKPEQIKKY
jgi:hypothetical protein